jgi:O-antigen/teichoic acid export membrane protein
MRRRAARGTVINSAFLVAVSSLGLLKGFLVAGFLLTTEYGMWGIVLLSLGTLLWLKDIGIGDRYVQQAEEDQEVAFQKAFTLELMVAAVFTALMLAAAPLVAFIYGDSDLLLPGVALAGIVFALALQSPIWVFYRRMDFVRQRLLLSVDPVLTFVVTVALAAAGLGVWSLILGTIAGSWAGALAALAASPYRIRLRFDRETARRYLSFSWPMLGWTASGMAMAQGSMLIGAGELGLAGAGAIALAASISAYVDRVDTVVTDTLYPAICKVKDRTDVLFETFVKSNRLALMWGVPFGVGLAVFAADLVNFGIGERWVPAIGVIQAFGLIAAANHLGFNWFSFYCARGDTRPLGVVGLVGLAVFLATVWPLTAAYGLNGFAIGIALVTAASLIARTFYLRRIFPGFRPLLHVVRAAAPTVPAVLVVLGLRLVDGPDRSLGTAFAELGLYLVVTVAATLVIERRLLREVAGYVRGGRMPRLAELAR